MKEIKFRAWVGNEKMITVESIRFFGDVIYVWSNEDDCVDQLSPKCIMQYTGLKDKNGEQVFEGDVIKIIPRYPEDDGTEYLRDNNFVIDDFCGDVCYLGQMVHPSNGEPEADFEIIGNIYENPELMLTD